MPCLDIVTIVAILNLWVFCKNIPDIVIYATNGNVSDCNFNTLFPIEITSLLSVNRLIKNSELHMKIIPKTITKDTDIYKVILNAFITLLFNPAPKFIPQIGWNPCPNPTITYVPAWINFETIVKAAM